MRGDIWGKKTDGAANSVVVRPPSMLMLALSKCVVTTRLLTVYDI
jgi:hypothetical protein